MWRLLIPIIVVLPNLFQSDECECKAREVTHELCGTGVTNGERLDRMVKFAHDDAMCNYFSIDNAYHYATDKLFYDGYPYGSDIFCTPPLTADEVLCSVSLYDNQFNYRTTVFLKCRGDKHCGPYGIQKGYCCHQ
jgi:hypothetical protein